MKAVLTAVITVVSIAALVFWKTKIKNGFREYAIYTAAINLIFNLVVWIV